MQANRLRRIALILLIASLASQAAWLVYHQALAAKVPTRSKYTSESVSDTLRTRIRSVERSILERQNTQFTAPLDPLRQGNRIKGRFEGIRAFEDSLRNTFLPISTQRDERTGETLAVVEFQDQTYTAREGDVIAGRRIIRITDQELQIYYQGLQIISVQPRPQIPQHLLEDLPGQTIPPAATEPAHPGGKRKRRLQRAGVQP